MAADEQDPRDRTLKLREAVAANPDSAEAHYRLGTWLLKVQRWEEAEAALRKAVELEPEYPEAWVNLGGLLFARFDFAGSVKANEQALAYRPELVKAHYNKGLGHLYLGEADKLVESFENVVNLDPSDAGGHYHLAVGLHATGRTEQARKAVAVAMHLGYAAQPSFIKALDQARDGEESPIVYEIKPRQPAGDPSSERSKDE